MKRLFAVLSAVAVLLLMLGPGAASADVYHVSLDLPSLGIGPSVTDLELEVDLYDHNFTMDPVNGSFALMDNVVLGTATDDFEDGTLGDFQDWLNPDSVDPVPGNLDGTGNYVMRIGEDPVWYPTITYRDYFGRDGDVLSFDVEVELEPGDELVFSLLDPSTLDPLVAGFTPGFADVAVVTADGLSVVPAPGACLLAILGFGSAGYGLRKRSISRTRTK